MRKIYSFDDIVGHKNLINFLKKKVQEDNVPNVAIFCGNTGIGKSSIAKVLAIETVTRNINDESIKLQYRNSIVNDGISTDSIKLFNMSTIQEKEEEIQKVVSELTTTFSKTKRKVLILDEAHNMSKRAQDAILVELEYLAEGVYVFICTTEVGSLRAAVLSRSSGPFQLSNLTDVEAKNLLKEEIEERNLSFDMNKEMIITLISSWACNQPRKMIKLLENFSNGCTVTAKELEVFINTTSSASIIELLKYLYGSMVLGIGYLDSMKYDESFPLTLIEVCKVAIGGQSKSISQKDSIYIANFMQGRNVDHIIKFTAEVAGLSELRKRNVISAFMRAHKDFMVKSAEELGVNTKAKDMRELQDNIEVNDIIGLQADIPKAPSLEEMFSSGQRF